MKTLYLLRHAKAAQDDDLDDRDRPLNKRGKQDCQLMAQPIAEHVGPIDQVFCSPARRARSTLKRVRHALDTPAGAITLDEALYTFDEQDLLDWLQQLDNNLSSVLITGHNPALANLIALLTGQSSTKFPTCAFAGLTLKIEYWDQVRRDCGKLDLYLVPQHFQ